VVEKRDNMANWLILLTFFFFTAEVPTVQNGNVIWGSRNKAVWIAMALFREPQQ
jgi:hypothetical protein